MDLRLLGPVEVHVDGEPVALGPPRQRAVLAMLALASPRIVSTDRFVDGLWGEEPPDKPLAALQVFVHGLRKALRGATDQDLVARAAPGYRLDVPADAVDVHRFERLHASARAHRDRGDAAAEEADLLAALGLWRGPALADLRSTPFAESEATRLEDLRLLAEEDLYDVQLQLGRHEQLTAVLDQRVREHPMRERLWGQLMTALYRCDRQADALATYARAREQLAEELGIDPGQALQQLEVAILRQDPALSPPAGQERQAVAPRPMTSVPPPLTATFGREELVAQVLGTLVRPDVRAVTLLGPGGSGKSRVAVLAAREAPDDFPGGVHFVAATELTSAGQLRAEVMLALTGSDAPEAVPATGDTLVVLDNLESVPDGSEVVGELIATLPAVTVLSTSRLPLELRAEHEVPVPPLPVPEPDAGPQQITASPAVRMFVDRVQAVDPDLDLTRHLPDVGALCRFVDGLPLAIELAAARIRLYTPSGLLAALQQDIGLLAAEDRDTPARQRTLATTLQWTFDQLSPDARRCAERLALFERGFTAEAVEAVSPDVPDVMGALAEMARARLIKAVPSAVEMRFVVLGTVRAFARGRLEEDAALPSLHHRLLAHLLDRSRTWADSLDGPDGSVVLGRYADSAADLDGALERATAEGDLGTAVDIAGVLADLWIASGRLNQGLAHCRRLLASDLDAAALDRVKVVEGKLRYHLGDFTGVAEVLDFSPADEGLAAVAACYRGGALVIAGDTEAGTGLAQRALDLATARGDYTVRVVALSMLAIGCAVRGDFEAERAYYEQRLAAVQEHGDLARLADTLNTLAEIALDEDSPDTAAAYAAESVTIAGTALPLEARDATITLARAALASGALDDARDRLRSATALADRTGQALALAQCLRVGACLAQRNGDPALAVRGFAAAQALSPAPGRGEAPPESDLRAGFEAARESLTSAEFDREWLLGRTLPLAGVRARLLDVPAV